ncbi:Mss4-like protein [Dendrothele bispora CBS 962.96]|uniref:Mss4-like protein n=1 Tax=Dendrothele bispora (strain CBS 962.96) TaxID=1314807 RepID=A0A4S8L8X0_DENBC|nr:Mss4-like protein [Dendrothele bispora CBS 962.96]
MSQDLWAALQQASSKPRPHPHPLSSFTNGISDVSNSDGETTNKYDLLCPRIGCGSVIIRQGVAKLKKRESIKMEPSDITPNPLLTPMPDSPEQSHWWLITPSPMEFENIGFSRPVESLSLSPSGKKLKLLACAECDLGPLGWSEEGGTEFWLACSRVGYRSSGA